MSGAASGLPRDPPRIVVVGSTMIDLVAYADPLPRAGETVVGQSFALGFGGKGANQAVMAARLGAEVVFVNCVGDDVFGQMTLENLAREGLATTAVRVTPGSTGVAPIWVEPDGTNRIIVIPGANAAVSAALVREELGGLDGADCVVAQLEVPGDAVLAAFEFGRRWGCPTVLNPAPAAALSDDLLALVDWLIPNEHEFEALFGSPPDNGALNARRPYKVVVTLGAEGAAASIDGSVRHFPAGEVRAVDSTGAGDAFVGGFVYSIATGSPPEQAIAFGNACGALSVTAPGTQASFPTRRAVDSLLALTVPVGTEFRSSGA